nr:MAG TPA: hypothetical protein [Caudoviricetes sp.]
MKHILWNGEPNSALRSFLFLFLSCVLPRKI